MIEEFIAQKKIELPIEELRDEHHEQAFRFAERTFQARERGDIIL
ncbi:MAG TPA: hypothetical protein VK712_00230 [Verrucomicrobiae bacterium]|jgi:hypothetical protein|nr:hypothetical protein [Verrucomicrobiae bacterium]